MQQLVGLELTLTGFTEEREDRWAVWCEELGFMVYGKTEEDANEAFRSSVVALLNSFQDDTALRNYLDLKSVQHHFVRTDVGERPSRRSRRVGRLFERQIEVPIGAATA